MHIDAFSAFAPSGPGDVEFVKRLQDSQWWPPAEVLEHQLQLLSSLLVHAHATVAFYRSRIEAAGIDVGRPVRLEDWRRIPPLTRREVQQLPDQLLSSAIPTGHGAPTSVHTSGSTNTPVTVTTTELDSWVGGLAALRHFLWHPYDFSSRMVTIRRYRKGIADGPDGEKFERWGNEGFFPFATGPSARLNISASIDNQVDWIVRQDPDYLCTYPSNAIQLTLASRRRGITFPHLEHVATLGEVVTPEARRLCTDVWDAPVIDTYSAQEVGILGHQCPEYQHYHVQAETVMLELINERGEACAVGEVGEILVTPLFNYAMPLLRYRLGDFAELGSDCSCGRGLPVLKRILGRERNSVLIAPSGERFWPVFGTHRFSRIAPIIQHQFVQRTPERVEARLVTERPLTGEEEEALRRHIQAQLPWRFEIVFAYLPEIPRSASGKFEPFISDVGPEAYARRPMGA